MADRGSPEWIRAAIARNEEENARLLRHVENPHSEPMSVVELRDLARRREEQVSHLREALRHASDGNIAIERAAMLGKPSETNAELLEVGYQLPDSVREVIEGAEAVAMLARDRIAEVERDKGGES